MYWASFVLLLFFASFVLFYGKWKVWLPRLLKQGTARHLANKYFLCTGSLVSPVGLFGTPEPSWAHACPRTSVLTLYQHPLVTDSSSERLLLSCSAFVLPLSCPAADYLPSTLLSLTRPDLFNISFHKEMGRSFIPLHTDVSAGCAHRGPLINIS